MIREFGSLLVKNIWISISIIESLVIAYLIYRVVQLSKNDRQNRDLSSELKEAKHSEVNMDDLLLSINSAGDLYNKLSRICHPDKFVGSNKHEIALRLFQEVTRNKRNFRKLKELEKEINQDLN